jgi:glutamate dehydrogenase/leucine dehydrogenase
MGVSDKELGYMFGQYKRINVKTTVAGKPFLQGGPTFSHVSFVWNVVYTYSL